jgi:23S rRNA (cytosine1962-C5)-methyltransferase
MRAMNPTVSLTSAKQHTFLKGHPWIFPKAIAHHDKHCTNGALVDVLDANGQPLATGVFNAHSMYRVRILAYAYEPVDRSSLEAILLYRLHQAKLVRERLHLPNTDTTAYRLFNSEADGLSGLTIDRFNQTCVIASSAFWVETHKDLVMHCFKAVMPEDTILWASQVKPLTQDGWVMEESPIHHRTEVVLEAGIRYTVDFSNTQKTGLFLDQRDNHQRIAALASGKRVLDLYTYTGGFALHAARGQAASVTAVDSSANAIADAKQNAELNDIHTIDFIKDDARNYLQRAGEYDLVILDPPKLVPSARHLERAKNYYRYLHRETLKHMQPGSLLMTCNCSSAMSSAQFAELVSLQAQAVNKTTRTLGIFGPAYCHPTLPGFPEGHYLTALLLAVI